MAEDKNKIYLSFEDTRSVILAEQDCKKAGFDCVAVPTPGYCGILLEVPVEQEDEVLEFLKKQKMSFKIFS